MNLICGINPVLEALAAGTRHFDRLLVVKGLRSRRLADAIGRATRLGIPLRFEMRETLDRLSGGVPHQGVIAVVSVKPVLTLEHLLDEARNPALLVALDGVEDPRNLGAILRSVEAAGADGALLPERHSAGLSETVGRTSAGAMEHVRVAQVGNLVQALETLKSRGVWVVGFDASGRERWDAVDLKQPVCLVLGGEGRGIRRLVREHCDHLVSIPHFGHVTSLNVSVAAGIALYEAVRQRGAVPSLVKPIPAAPAGETQVVGPRPDDDEDDPGAAPSAPAPELPEDEGDENAPETLPPHVDIHGEEVAWGQGPTVLKPVRSRRGRGAPVRRRKGGPRRSAAGGQAKGESETREAAGRDGAARDGDGDERKSQPRAAGDDSSDEKTKGDTGAPDAPAARRGRRRRRRKRPGETATKSSVPRPASKGSAEGAEPAPEDGDKPPAPRGRRRGRRRRR